MRYTGPSCRQCRREGTKLFLKGTKCFTEKCPVERRPTPPGQHGASTARRRKTLNSVLYVVLIVVVIALGTWGLLRESLDLAMDAVPDRIDPSKVEAYFTGLPGVTAFHDLHIWGMSTTEAALTVHLVKPDAAIDDALLARIKTDMQDRFGIGHTTVQFELGDAAHPCGQAPVGAL